MESLSLFGFDLRVQIKILLNIADKSADDEAVKDNESDDRHETTGVPKFCQAHPANQGKALQQEAQDRGGYRFQQTLTDRCGFCSRGEAAVSTNFDGRLFVTLIEHNKNLFFQISINKIKHNNSEVFTIH